MIRWIPEEGSPENEEIAIDYEVSLCLTDVLLLERPADYGVSGQFCGRLHENIFWMQQKDILLKHLDIHVH